MRRTFLAMALVALTSCASFAQTPTPTPRPTPTPAPAPKTPFRLIVAPNTVNNTLAVLKCEPHEIIMSAVCNNHFAPVQNPTTGPEVAATYLNKTTAECRGGFFADSAVAICADYGQAQPSKN